MAGFEVTPVAGFEVTRDSQIGNAFGVGPPDGITTFTLVACPRSLYHIES